MEVNKDEAYRCLDRAEYYIGEGDVEKAEKFINKSKKLFPTSEADGKYFCVSYILCYL
jgi:DnaJ homolog subfamily B member 12